MDQLALQQTAIRSQVTDLESKLKSATNASETESLQQQRRELLRQQPTMENIRWPRALAASVVYCISLLPAAIFFYQVLVHMKQKPSFIAAVRAHILGHMGKYVPGKAMVVILRTGAITGPDVRASVAVVAAMIETLLMMAVGGTLAGVLVVGLQLPPWITALAIGLAACASIPTLPPIFSSIVQRIADSKLGSGKGLADAGIDWHLISRGWGWMLAMWLAIGFSFALLIQSVPGVDPQQFAVRDYLLAIATIALAMVAGFVSLLPGGAGVRELVVSAVLAPRFGIVPALVAAILARLIFLAVDVISGGVLWLWKPKQRNEVDEGQD